MKSLDFGSDRPFLLFGGGLTDFEFKVTYENLCTGESVQFLKPADRFTGFVDTTTLDQNGCRPATLSVSPASLSFTGTAGGAAPGGQVLSISNSGGGSMSWNATASAPWITLSQTAGTGSGTTWVGVNPAGLPAGTQYGKVVVTASAQGSPKEIPVTLALTGGTPVANFTFAPSSPKTGDTIQFTDTSAGSPTSWNWTFGDGTSSSQRNPAKSYTVAGSYSVKLTSANGGGASSVTRVVSVAAATVAESACYLFDEGVDSTAHDSCGADNAAAIVGATFGTGQSGGALHFAASSDRLLVPRSVHSGWAGPFYFECWLRPKVRPQGFDLQYVLVDKSAANSTFKVFYRGDESLYVSVRDSSNRELDWFALTLVSGSWNKAEIWFDGVSLEVRLNGQDALGRGETPQVDWTAGGDVVLGNSDVACSNCQFQGDIDGVKLLPSRP